MPETPRKNWFRMPHHPQLGEFFNKIICTKGQANSNTIAATIIGGAQPDAEMTIQERTIQVAIERKWLQIGWTEIRNLNKHIIVSQIIQVGLAMAVSVTIRFNTRQVWGVPRQRIRRTCRISQRLTCLPVMSVPNNLRWPQGPRLVEGEERVHQV